MYNIYIYKVNILSNMDNNEKQDLVKQFAKLSKIDQEKLLSNLVVDDSNKSIKSEENKIINVKKIFIGGKKFYKEEKDDIIYIWNNNKSGSIRVGTIEKGNNYFWFKDNNIDLTTKIKLGVIE